MRPSLVFERPSKGPQLIFRSLGLTAFEAIRAASDFIYAPAEVLAPVARSSRGRSAWPSIRDPNADQASG